MLTCILVSVGILGCTFWSVYTNELFCRFSCHGQKLAIGPGNVCTSVAHANEYSILHQQQNIPSRNKSWMEGIWNLAYLWDPELFLISVFFVRPISIIPVFQWIKKIPLSISFHFLLFGSRIFSHTFQIIDFFESISFSSPLCFCFPSCWVGDNVAIRTHRIWSFCFYIKVCAYKFSFVIFWHFRPRFMFVDVAYCLSGDLIFEKPPHVYQPRTVPTNRPGHDASQCCFSWARERAKWASIMNARVLRSTDATFTDCLAAQRLVVISVITCIPPSTSLAYHNHSFHTINRKCWVS